jgi:hypothetical protein
LKQAAENPTNSSYGTQTTMQNRVRAGGAQQRSQAGQMDSKTQANGSRTFIPVTTGTNPDICLSVSGNHPIAPAENVIISHPDQTSEPINVAS